MQMDLSKLSPQQRAQYEATLAERRAAYQQHLDKAFTVSDTMEKWAREMAIAHGNTKVGMWAQELPWIQALLVARYGEAVEHWPAEFSADDDRRAWEWRQGGRVPAGVHYLTDHRQTGAMVLGLLLALFLVTQVGVWGLTLLPLLGTAMSDYLEGQIRAHIFRTASFTKPTVLAVALYTAAPGEAGGGTEVTGGSYARVQRDPLDANWTAASATDGLTDNAAALTFPAPTAAWGQVTHFAILDATTAGNFLIYGALTTPKTVNDADPAPSFATGDLDVTFA